MPKLKTKRAAAKRFRVTRRKKVMIHHAGHSHLLRKKRPDRRRRLRQPDVLQGGDRRKVYRMIPYAL